MSIKIYAEDIIEMFKGTYAVSSSGRTFHQIGHGVSLEMAIKKDENTKETK